ncbi:hypothetical protein [Blautia difficilis]|uniref:Uncharacterized protein n=1 Tax=Blautia difficilis TaxID=2763027 RepID=A0ABR7IHQ7_9FIRM|nr:hypothetical protein [Blautia difficilis]MBC5779572.1 hypothetical protein [Blautia difficilis]
MRGKRRVVESTSEEIKSQITSIEEQIIKLTEDIKGLRAQKKELAKDLIAAEKKETAVKEEQAMKDLANLLKEKGLTVEEVRNIIDK